MVKKAEKYLPPPVRLLVAGSIYTHLYTHTKMLGNISVNMFVCFVCTPRRPATGQCTLSDDDDDEVASVPGSVVAASARSAMATSPRQAAPEPKRKKARKNTCILCDEVMKVGDSLCDEHECVVCREYAGLKGKTIADLVAKGSKSTADQISLEIAEMKMNKFRLNDEEPKFRPESVFQDTITASTLCEHFAFVSKQVFKKRYGASLDDLKLQCVRVLSAKNEWQVGVLLAIPDQDPILEVLVCVFYLRAQGVAQPQHNQQQRQQQRTTTAPPSPPPSPPPPPPPDHHHHHHHTSTQVKTTRQICRRVPLLLPEEHYWQQQGEQKYNTEAAE